MSQFKEGTVMLLLFVRSHFQRPSSAATKQTAGMSYTRINLNGQAGSPQLDIRFNSANHHTTELACDLALYRYN